MGWEIPIELATQPIVVKFYREATEKKPNVSINFHKISQLPLASINFEIRAS